MGWVLILGFHSIPFWSNLVLVQPWKHSHLAQLGLFGHLGINPESSLGFNSSPPNKGWVLSLGQERRNPCVLNQGPFEGAGL